MKLLSTKDFYIRIESLSVEVTGSCNYLVFHFPNGEEVRILVDCGLFVPRNEIKYNSEISFDCKKILAVLVTHSHTDHYARIPYLYSNGFNGKVYGSKYTVEKMKTDAMKNYFSMRRTYTSALYEEKDTVQFMENSEEMELYKTYHLTENIDVELVENAHQKGAVMYLITSRYEEREIRVLFTGDYKFISIFGKSYFPLEGKKYDKPITIVTEATHGIEEEPEKVFCKELIKAIEEKKSVIIIANGDGRFEAIASEIKQMKLKKEIPNDIPIYLELKKNFDLAKLDLDVLPSNINFVNKPDGRKEALFEKRQKIVILTNRGTTDFFLKNTIEGKKYVIFYISYVSKGSIADKIINTPKGEEVVISKIRYKKCADVRKTDEYSGHDFYEGIIKLLKGFRNITGILLEHGTDENKDSLRNKIMQSLPKSRIFKLERGKAFRITEKGIKYSK